MALLEVAVRPALSWRSPPVIAGFAIAPTVLWRRSRPLTMVALAFGAASALSLARLSTGGDWASPHAMIFMLLLPYALLRHASGRQIGVGVVILIGAASLGLVAERRTLGDVLGAFAVLLAAAALGAAARYRESARLRELEQVKMQEREQLARDLHDTVAHHVSAIAICAQAGLATASARPEAAVDALGTIAREASRTLAEMRAMVRLLRHDDLAERTPSPRVADLSRLAGTSGEGPQVDVDVQGDLDDLPPAVSAALYRLAQESITNARRHARRATRIEVAVTADDASVRLSVRDDGEPTRARPAAPSGYGLPGMRERAALLGGTCHAGPDPERGWTVTAVLPRRGSLA